MKRRSCLLALALTVVAPPLHGQQPLQLLARGVEAYQHLDLDQAVSLLRASLASTAGDGLQIGDQVRALTYLGAAELFRTHTDSARAAFRRIVTLDPEYRPDQTVFPPQVTELFTLVRRASPAVAVRIAPVTTFTARTESLHVYLLGSDTATRARVRLERDDGQLVRQLYDGIVGDSVTVGWDGQSAGGTAVAAGRYRLTVTTIGSTTNGDRVARVPLIVERQAQTASTPATPATPPDSLLLPERSAGGSGWPSLAAGAGGALVAAALPAAINPGGEDGHRRFVVSIAIGAAGLAGFMWQQRGHALPDNIRANAALRQQWARRAGARSSATSGDVTLTVRAGSVGNP
jgi:flagellar hook capping protein FlgD